MKNHFDPISQITLPLEPVFYLVEICFKRILDYGQWQRILCLLETIFFHSYFLKPLLQLEGGQYFKNSYICLWKLFSSFFSDTDLNRSSYLMHWNRIFSESFILASGIRFLVNYKPCVFIKSFFLLVDTILGIRYKPIFLHFSTPFSGFRKLFIECFISASWNIFTVWYSSIQSKYCAGWNHYSINVKLFFNFKLASN